jgi:hypothetical protein
MTLEEQVGYSMALILAVACIIYAIHCAYYNGVNDGYGATIEPWNPGYRKARAYLTKYWGLYADDNEENHDL